MIDRFHRFSTSQNRPDWNRTPVLSSWERTGCRYRQQKTEDEALPTMLVVGEVAELLRTTRKATYLMIERGQLPGVVRIGRRVLVRRDDLVQWLRQKSAPSLER